MSGREFLHRVIIEIKMETQKLLENLTALYAQKDLLQAERRQLEENAIPQEVAKKLSDIREEFSPKENTINIMIEELEKSVKTSVLEEGKTIKGGSLQAVFTKGRTSWDTSGLDGLMVAVPQLAQFKKVGLPSVSIRKI